MTVSANVQSNLQNFVSNRSRGRASAALLRGMQNEALLDRSDNSEFMQGYAQMATNRRRQGSDISIGLWLQNNTVASRNASNIMTMDRTQLLATLRSMGITGRDIENSN